MGTLAIDADTTNSVDSRGTTYATEQGADAADYARGNGSTIRMGQNISDFGVYTVMRSGLRFDMTGLPTSSEITGATLKIYGETDRSTTEFDITIVEAVVSDPVQTTDYGKFETTDFGNLTTVGYDLAGWNTITFSAAGVTYLNTQRQLGVAQLGLRSSRDISITAPSGEEYVYAHGLDSSHIPILTLTYADWPDVEYPSDPLFPTQGKIDLETYSIIKSYLEAADLELTAIADGDGNIDLAVGNWITWTGTSEKIAWDNANSRVTFTSLAAGADVESIVGTLVTADITIAGGGTANGVDCTVAGNMLFNDALSYLLYDGMISTDNALVLEGTTTPASIANNYTQIYMLAASGDVMLRLRFDAQGGTKTMTLADFSAM